MRNLRQRPTLPAARRLTKPVKVKTSFFGAADDDIISRLAELKRSKGMTLVIGDQRTIFSPVIPSRLGLQCQRISRDKTCK